MDISDHMDLADLAALMDGATVAESAHMRAALDGAGHWTNTADVPAVCWASLLDGAKARAAIPELYVIECVKGRRELAGTLDAAIGAAHDMDTELQPAYGVTVEDSAGRTVAAVRDNAVAVWIPGV